MPKVPVLEVAILKKLQLCNVLEWIHEQVNAVRDPLSVRLGPPPAVPFGRLYWPFG